MSGVRNACQEDEPIVAYSIRGSHPGGQPCDAEVKRYAREPMISRPNTGGAGSRFQVRAPSRVMKRADPNAYPTDRFQNRMPRMQGRDSPQLPVLSST